MKKNTDYIERVVYLVGFIFLLIASITGILLDGDPQSIIEWVAPSAIVIPTIHIFCATLSLFLIFKPSDKLFIIIVMVESFLLNLTNYTILGIFFFYAAVILIVCKGLFPKNQKKILNHLAVIHFISLIGTFPRGWQYMLIHFGYSAFSLFFYLWIYYILKARFSCFLPTNVTQQTIINQKPGSPISLADYKLSERQSNFVLANLHRNLSYKEISEEYFVSVSTVKKEFAEVYKVFNVSKLEELRILLLQYQVEE